MTESPSCHREIIDRWPTLRAFADDIGVAYGTAKAMRRRNSIPDQHRPRVVESAFDRGFDGITFELLTRLAAAAPGVSDSPDTTPVNAPQETAGAA